MTSGYETLEAELKELIAKRQITVVVGSGVSVATTGNADTASWTGLLQSGIGHCQIVGKSENWARLENGKLAEAIREGDLDDLLSVAQQITTTLKKRHPGEYGRWLDESLNPYALDIKDDSLIHAIASLDATILTTNYDDLIERVTGLASANWSNVPKIRKILRGEDSGVIHLHGLWDDPDSVVLGIQDYDQVKSDPHTQAVMRGLGLTKSLLLVGCGDGLHDPNFGQFLSWLGQVSRLDHYRNFRLSKTGDVDQHQSEHDPDQRIFVLPYGPKHDDLPRYLQSLAAPAGSQSATRATKPIASDVDLYLESLCQRHGKLELIGMGAGLQLNLPISQAYVPLRTCHYGHSAEPRQGKFDDKAFQRAEYLEQDVKLHEVFQCAGQQQRRGVLLLGEPGAGKTTGARQFCYRVASGEDRAEDLGLPPGTLPVFVRLRTLQADEIEQGLEAFIDGQISVESADGEKLAVGPKLRESERSLLWIFDGLDEVVDETTRRKVCSWIGELLSARQLDRFVVTSRYQGYEGKVDLGDEFLRFEVQPLDPLTAGQFVHKWFRVVYGCMGLSKEGAESKAETLNELLGRPSHEVGRLAELRSNPLLLTIVCLVYHEDSSLPKSRARLYERCIKVLLQTWRQGMHVASGGTPYDPDAAKEVLAAIAWQMHHTEDRRALPLAQMRSSIGAQLPGYTNVLGGMDATEFLRLMLQDSGILAASGSGNVEFLHLTFQEYLAAYYAAQQNEATALAENIHVSWWHEVILLALAQGKRDFSRDFFHAALSSKQFESHLDFIQRCVDEAVPFIDQPFFDVLRSRRATRLKAKVLRLLQDKGSDALLETCQQFSRHKSKELSGLAREILQRAGREFEARQPDQKVVKPDEAVRVRDDSLVDSKTGIALIRIPAGSFMMGDDGWSDSQPVHRVRISDDFYLGKYPVTNEEYARFLKATGYRELDHWDDSRFNQPRQPVVGVSREDAIAFCDWAGFVLPTEAQWEYACRAGSSTAYYFGDDKSQLGDHAWFDKNSEGATHLVGGKLPNTWQLYDMAGNVYEWCNDFINEDYYKASPEVDPPGADVAKIRWTDTPSARVCRGGGWTSDAAFCRSGCRSGYGSSFRHRYLGFRVSRPLSSS